MSEINNESINIEKTSSPKYIYYIMIFLSLVGLSDALYLTSRYYKGVISCSIIEGCQEVMLSSYSHIKSIPISLLGVSYYFIILIAIIFYLSQKNKIAKLAIKILPWLAFAFSLWLLYIQAFVLKYFCQYCLLSTATAAGLLIGSYIVTKKKI